MGFASRLLVVVGLFAVGSCSNGGENDSTSNGTSTSGDPTALVDGVAAAQCRKLFECCTGEELADVFGGLEVSDQSSCEDAIRTQSEAFFRPELERAIADESIVLNDDELDRCVATLDARSCSNFQPLASANVLEQEGCRGVVEPQLTLSAFCTEDFECETGFCSHPPQETEGACKNPPSAGEACLNDRCGDGLYCTMMGVCEPRLAAGEPCTRNADCRSELCEPDETGEVVCDIIPQICTGS